MPLDSENYTLGFLHDSELLGGVTEDPDQAGQFVAFVLRHTTGEYLGYRKFASLQDALSAINFVKRDWEFRPAKECGGGGCNGKGGCGGKGGCHSHEGSHEHPESG